MECDLLAPLAIALFYFRSCAGWSRDRLAQAMGTTRKRIGEWEAGNRTLSRKKALKLLALLGYSPADLDQFLGEVARRRAQALRGMNAGSAEEETLARVSADLAAFLTEELAAIVRLHQAEEAKSEAARLWQQLARRTEKERRARVEGDIRYQTWAFALRLGQESARAASDRADRALELAGLSVTAAERAPMPGPRPEGFRRLLQADCWAFLGNARRVAGQLPLAREAFGRAETFAREGEGGDPDRLLNQARRLDLEASLRKHLGELPQALDLLDRALGMGAVGEERGRLLLQEATVYSRLDQPERAIEALREAAVLIGNASDHRPRFSMTFNLGVNFCHLDRFAEASALLPEVRALAIEGRQELDMVRVLWLEGRTVAGLGNREKGAEAIGQVYQDFKHNGIDYDAGLAALELAALHIELGHPRKARMLAEELVPLFQAQGVELDLLAALTVWVEAAHRECASAETARDLLRRLERRRPLEAEEPGARS